MIDDVPECSVQDLARRLDAPDAASRPVLLDVRLPREHQLVTLPGAILIPLHELEARVHELEPFRHRELVVFCHHGVRSLTGAALCQAAGFHAVSLEGGIDAWSLEIDPALPRY